MPASELSLTSLGRPVMLGASLSVTVTVKVEDVVLPLRSVAVKVTTVAPTGKLSPEAASPLNVSSTQLSAAVGSVQVTAAEQSPASLFTEMSAGVPEITGASSSAPPPPQTPHTSTTLPSQSHSPTAMPSPPHTPHSSRYAHTAFPASLKLQAVRSVQLSASSQMPSLSTSVPVPPQTPQASRKRAGLVERIGTSVAERCHKELLGCAVR